jgi:hypothetical protein
MSLNFFNTSYATSRVNCHIPSEFLTTVRHKSIPSPSSSTITTTLTRIRNSEYSSGNNKS